MVALLQSGDLNWGFDGLASKCDYELADTIFQGAQNAARRDFCDWRLEFDLSEAGGVCGVAGLEAGGDQELGVLVGAGKFEFGRLELQGEDIRAFGKRFIGDRRLGCFDGGSSPRGPGRGDGSFS